MTSKTHHLLIVLLLAFALPAAAAPVKHEFAIGAENFTIDGNKLVIRCGEMHFARIPPEYWRHRLKMAKAMGLNTV